MPSPTLLIAGSISVVVGISFTAVARAISRMQASGDGRTALRGYAIWWIALAFYLVLQGVFTVLAGFDVAIETVYIWSRAVLIPVLCIGVWGLTSYLLYLYTGDRRVFVVVGVFYAVVALLFYWAQFSQVRPGIQVERWIVTVDDTSALYRIVYVLVGAPPIAAALAYLGLLRRVEHRVQKYRIILVASSILAYVGSGLVARLTAGDAAIFVTLVVFGSLAAAASLLAYYPPGRWRAWLERDPRDDHADDERLAMEYRMLQLI